MMLMPYFLKIVKHRETQAFIYKSNDVFFQAFQIEWGSVRNMGGQICLNTNMEPTKAVSWGLEDLPRPERVGWDERGATHKDTGIIMSIEPWHWPKFDTSLMQCVDPEQKRWYVWK